MVLENNNIIVMNSYYTIVVLHCTDLTMGSAVGDRVVLLVLLLVYLIGNFTEAGV